MERVPRVTIGLPVFNGENYLEETLRSIRAQSYEDFELIVSDNASTDRTREILLDHAADDRRILTVLHESNRGPTENYNRLIPLARGDFFKWACHDDLLAPDFLERCVPVLEEDEEVVLAHGRTMLIGPEGEALGEPEVARLSHSHDVAERVGTQIWEGYCHQIFGLIRISALRRVRPLGAYANHDGVMLVRLVLLGRFHEVPEVLFYYRRHPSQSMDHGAGDYREYSAWFDPSNVGRVFLPMWRIGWEYLEAVGTAPLPAKDKVRCLPKLGSWGWRFRGRLAGDVTHAAGKLGRRLAGPGRPPS